MGQLLRYLPAFATDYSAAMSMLSDLRGFVVLCAPGGCMGNFTGFDEPRWFRNPNHVFLLEMCETESIFGDISGHLKAIVDAVGNVRAPFVSFLTSPVSALIGLDIAGLMSEVKALTGLPCICVNTDGYGTYHDGIRKASDAILDAFPLNKGNSGSGVNILGYSPLEHSYEDIRHIIKMISESGERFGVCFPMSDADYVKYLGNSRLNLVISSSAIPAAKRMEEEYGIPYGVCMPIGVPGKMRLRDVLSGCEETPINEAEAKVLIVGEQVRSNAIRNLLMQNDVYSDVGTYFSFFKEISHNGDRLLKSEADITNMISDGSYSHVIADPLFRPLIPEDVEFIEEPCAMVSSKLYWNVRPNIFDPQWVSDISALRPLKYKRI